MDTDTTQYHCTQTRVCHWKPDDPDMGTWIGRCGCEWAFLEAGPVENHVNYCPQCGGAVIVVAEEPT